ncbi:MAG: flavin reductase family protein [Ruminiclostridium sp.]|nr:flavin reductase family protein [Ruminiclostridium sp.]
MNKATDPFVHSREITEALPGGILLTSAAEGRVNTMTIGWGALGTDWGKPMFLALVRESRFTRELIDKNPEFTINVPYGEFDRKILGFCGSKSGRDVDKIKELGLTLVDSQVISVPGIKELPLTLECRVAARQKQEPALIGEAYRKAFYPEPCDAHIMYFGEIVNAYIIS